MNIEEEISKLKEQMGKCNQGSLFENIQEQILNNKEVLRELKDLVKNIAVRLENDTTLPQGYVATSFYNIENKLGGETEMVKKGIEDDSLVDKPEPIRLSSNERVLDLKEGVPSIHSKPPIMAFGKTATLEEKIDGLIMFLRLGIDGRLEQIEQGISILLKEVADAELNEVANIEYITEKYDNGHEGIFYPDTHTVVKNEDLEKMIGRGSAGNYGAWKKFWDEIKKKYILKKKDHEKMSAL